MSFKLRVEKKEPQLSQKEELKQATYPVYRLRWEKLKAFLEKRFPEHKFQERRVRPFSVHISPSSPYSHASIVILIVYVSV
jgi:hypothetical protein